MLLNYDVGEDAWESFGLQGQSILKEMNPEYSWDRLMLKLKFQYFDHLMWRVDSLEKILMLGKIEVRRRKQWQRMRWLDGILTQWTWVWASFRRWWRTGKTSVLQSMGSQRVRHEWATEQQQVKYSTWAIKKKNGREFTCDKKTKITSCRR